MATRFNFNLGWKFVVYCGLFFQLAAFSASVPISEACRVALAKLPVLFTSNETDSHALKIETPMLVTETLQKAVAEVDKRGISDPALYRAAVQKEIAREKATLRAQESVTAAIESGALKLPAGEMERERAIKREIVKRAFDELKHADRETILFVDTPILGIDGKSLNKTVPLVVDHHGAYAPKNPLDNSGAQVILRLKEVAERPENKSADGTLDTQKALLDFRRSLFGGSPGKITLSSDNLADAAEVMAFLKNPLLQKRILENPATADMLLESGRFTDFFVFGGDAYEKNNLSEKSKQAIALSKAIMQSHSDLLKEYGVAFGDRVVGIKDKQKQSELLQKATAAAEALLLAATAPKNEQTASGAKALSDLEEKFNTARNIVSLNEARKMHAQFMSGLTGDLSGLANANELEKTVNQYTYGFKPVSTGNQFADWGASPIANSQDPKPRPIGFELGGTNASDIGKPVIIAKSGSAKVNLQPLGEALNQLAREKKRKGLLATGMSEPEVNTQLNGYTEFVPRGTDLVFSFGGHSLTRAEIARVVAETLKEKGDAIVPH